MTDSGYRLLWLQVFFDLPVKSKVQRKEASDFRNALLDLGFSMAQFSVYWRYCSDRDQAETMMKKVELSMPEEGVVQMLVFTDKQYENIRTINNGIKKRLKNKDQLMLF
ncbi:MAG: CRISPR-associated endonuclease Cas2 [Proteobacteria bacterium]|jgi:CRISPR-associated protein Cas2|nr:CRISPR-associated endonuclease Cas2 [Pseudomonadota bacterium]